MPRVLKETITIADADGNNALPYKLLKDPQDAVLWGEESVSDDNMPPGEPVARKWRFWSGMGETSDMGRGGYFFSENAGHGDPFALKPRPEITILPLTDNASPVTHFFEVKSASGIKYLYPITGTKVHKIQISGTPVLKNTKDFSTPNVEFATGSYTSDGGPHSFPVGFPVKAIIIKAIDGAYAAVIKTDQMGVASYKAIDGTYTTGDGSDAVVFTGETVGLLGSNTGFNHSGTTYHWTAFGGSDAYVKTGKFSGDATDPHDVTIAAGWGQPDALFAFTDNDADHVVFKPKDASADISWDLNGGSREANLVQATAGWPTDGFEVGDDNRVNRSGTNNVFYLALKEDVGVLKVDSYTGNGTDDRNYTGVGFDCTFALICTAYDSAIMYPVHRSDKCSGDSTLPFKAHAWVASLIKDLITNGFQLGTDGLVNQNGETYYYLAARPDPAYLVVCGQPAKWNDIWELPRGDIMDWAGLTAIVDGDGDDTWTPRTDLKATHFCTLKNKVARAYSDRSISLCSADDVSDSGNWGAPYNIGPPGTVITHLDEWGDELAVSATDGMYMFDGVARSVQQLPLLGGLTDDDNGKGTFRMASFLFYPSMDGFYRWYYGQHIRKDPETDRYYVPAKETTNEPLNLKHYGSAYCGDHIYHACYDGTAYHLMHGRLLNEAGDILWDCLLRTTNVIKAVRVTSNRYLVFGYENDLAYIKLSQGGEPDGGNFGNASLVTTIYERELILADDAEVRLRMVKVITRNMADGGADTYKWELHASRDGAAFGSQVGEDVIEDGVNKRYWDPKANLTARRLRLKEVGTATAGYTPAATAPEIIFAGVYGETVPDDAVVIKAVIDLERSGRSAAKVKSELRARENAGVVQVRDPVEDTVLNMIIYKCDLANVKQKGHEPPVAAMVVYMRYGDVS